MNSTQNWTDENVAKLVKQKQKEELENILKHYQNIGYVRNKDLINYLVKRLKELEK